LWPGIALTGAALDADRRPAWIRAWATVAGSFAANQAIKLAIRRPRPQVEGLPPLMRTMSNRSYPSAHATTSAAAMVALPRIAGASAGGASARALAASARPAIASAAVAMSLSRLYLGVHWPSDVAAGFALGLAVGELAS
jgi:undecaprenyl-diphosphatase